MRGCFYFVLSGAIIGLSVLFTSPILFIIGFVMAFGPFIVEEGKRGLDPKEVEKMNKENEMINRYVGKYRNHHHDHDHHDHDHHDHYDHDCHD